MATARILLVALLIGASSAGAGIPFERDDGRPLPSSPGSDHARATGTATRFDSGIVGFVARVSVTAALPQAGAEQALGARPASATSQRYQLIGVLLTALAIGLVGIWRLARRGAESRPR